MGNWKGLFPKENIYFETDYGILYCGDSKEILKKFPKESIDLVVTDPPYFNIMKRDWKGKRYSWDKWKNREEYLDFVKIIFNDVKRILKQIGSLYVFQDDKNVAYMQIELEKLGFYLENHIVWYKRNNMSIKGWTKFRSFAPVTERILFFSKEFRSYNLRDMTQGQIEALKPIVEYFLDQKEKIKKIMNFKTNKEFNEFINKITGTKSVASRHYFSYSQFIFPTKEIYEKLQSINNIIGNDYEVFKKEYENMRRYFYQDENYTDVWDIPMVGGNEVVNHPTQKPIKVIDRIIKCSSKTNDIVLDPFIGSGTTAVACEQTGRRWIGIEISKEYCEIVSKRIYSLISQGKLF